MHVVTKGKEPSKSKCSRAHSGDPGRGQAQSHPVPFHFCRLLLVFLQTAMKSFFPMKFQSAMTQMEEMPKKLPLRISISNDWF